MDIATTNQITNERCVEQHFNSGQASTIFANHQALRNNRTQIERKVHKHVFVRRFRKEVQNPFHRLIGIIRVQCGQTQMPGFRESNCAFHRFSVANFANHDHIGRFAHRIFQRFGIRVRVEANFALINDRFLVLMQKLNRIFNRQNVARGIHVTIVQHRRQRRTLARTSCANHKD